MSTSSIVLVHGSFMSDWCWIPVIDRLERAGITAHAVELPFTSIDDDVAVLRDAIDAHRGDGPVTAVCHSYSGITMSLAGHRADRLVYVAARLPEPGEPPSASTETWGTPEFRSSVSFVDGTYTLDADARDLLFQRSPAALADLAMRHRRPMRSWIPTAPIEAPAWQTVPTTYVVCTDDRTVRVDQQRARAALVHEAVEIDADHSPFFSAPDRLAEVLLTRHVVGATR